MGEGEEQIIQRLLQTREELRSFAERRMNSLPFRDISADDVLQDVWIAAIQYSATATNLSPSAFRRWVFTLARSKLSDAIRLRRRIKRGGQTALARTATGPDWSFADLFVALQSPDATPSREVSVAEAADALRIALGALPTNRRQAVVLHHIEGHSLPEVARAMSKTPAAVNSLVYHGLKQLRQSIGSASKFFSDAP